MTVLVAPSLLSADLTNLREEIQLLEEAKADWLHLDIMDGHYVPNLTFGPSLISSLRKITKLPLDVHLMISPVSGLLNSFINAGADRLTIHHDSEHHPHRLLEQIKARNIKAGIAVNPGTSLSILESLFPFIDHLLFMSVNPGFGGQKFIPQTIEKIKLFKEQYAPSFPQILIQIDGGIDDQTAPLAIKAGAKVLVAGHYIFSSDNGNSYAAQIANLKRGS